MEGVRPSGAPHDRHIGKHIPGNPNVVPQNMVAGGINMANNLYNTAPRDGTTIGMMGNNFRLAAMGANVKFDAGKMQWLGTIASGRDHGGVAHRRRQSVDDLRRQRDDCRRLGRGAITYFYPMMMNAFLETKFDCVTGYPGGNQINLAMTRQGAGAQQHLVELEGDAAK